MIRLLSFFDTEYSFGASFFIANLGFRKILSVLGLNPEAFLYNGAFVLGVMLFSSYSFAFSSIETLLCLSLLAKLLSLISVMSVINESLLDPSTKHLARRMLLLSMTLWKRLIIKKFRETNKKEGNTLTKSSERIT